MSEISLFRTPIIVYASSPCNFSINQGLQNQIKCREISKECLYHCSKRVTSARLDSSITVNETAQHLHGRPSLPRCVDRHSCRISFRMSWTLWNRLRCEAPIAFARTQHSLRISVADSGLLAVVTRLSTKVPSQILCPCKSKP